MSCFCSRKNVKILWHCLLSALERLTSEAFEPEELISRKIVCCTCLLPPSRRAMPRSSAASKIVSLIGKVSARTMTCVAPMLLRWVCSPGSARRSACSTLRQRSWMLALSCASSLLLSCPAVEVALSWSIIGRRVWFWSSDFLKIRTDLWNSSASHPSSWGLATSMALRILLAATSPVSALLMSRRHAGICEAVAAALGLPVSSEDQQPWLSRRVPRNLEPMCFATSVTLGALEPTESASLSLVAAEARASASPPAFLPPKRAPRSGRFC
mmetsp:Transcript_2571/g.5384  ORF Transcript_2571/g.5384 Transcript_2571/m.5384 type:complete len:270 (-) Transcript_2571:1-810(-)